MKKDAKVFMLAGVLMLAGAAVALADYCQWTGGVCSGGDYIYWERCWTKPGGYSYMTINKSIGDGSC